MKDEVKIFTKKQPTAKPTTEEGKRSGNRHNPSPGRIWKKGCVAKPPKGSVNATYIAATIAPYATSFVVIFNVVTSVFLFLFEGVPTPQIAITPYILVQNRIIVNGLSSNLQKATEHILDRHGFLVRFN